jgi:formylmethanofuran dehydrogenase subunit B
MDATVVVKIMRKYKACPKCGSSCHDSKLKVKLENEVLTIYCECGFIKKVDENNQEIK